MSPARRGRRRSWHVSFRARVLLALTGSVVLLALAGFAAVLAETNRQVGQTIARTAARGQQALAEIERFRRADLERVASRITGSIRIVAALDAALDDRDAAAFVENVRYELKLSELGRGLVAFSDERGRPFVTLVDGRPVPAREPASEGASPDRPLEPAAAGYLHFGDTLFSVQSYPLELFGRSVGALSLGFPIDDEVASRLGDLVNADVCFVADGHSVVATKGVEAAGLRGAMIEAAERDRPTVIAQAGQRVALVSSRLAASRPTFAVLAVPLDDALMPFERIRLVEAVASGGALAIAIVLGLLLSKRLTTPIRMLVSATERVRQGDFDFTVTVPHADELGTLAGAFNQMTQGLLIKERYRSVLDKVVSPTVAEELMKGDIRLGGETRDLTTLFADVRGFTTLTESMDPQEAIAILNEWLNLAAGAIQAEGGIVDKYVGDQVMAVFGAPVAQESHEAHAVRAGLRLRDLTLELNERREDAGRPGLSIGIGINSGAAVAGNMGSTNRLNYSVLGTSVNTAARLCSEAGAGELLIGESTYAAVASMVLATRQEPRVLKGLSIPSSPYLVHKLADGPGRERLRGSAATALLLVLGVLLAAPSGVAAQLVNTPTLSELGVEYTSPGGLVQVRPSVRATLNWFVPTEAPTGLINESGAFVDGSARLFVDLFAGRRFYATTEVRVDRGQPARAGSAQLHLQQAFVRITPSPRTKFSVQVGKFISPLGNYPQRAHTNDDPFVRPPLLYDHRTVMQSATVPGTADALFTWKTKPEFRAAGLPIVWDVPYPVGAAVNGGWRGLALAAALVTTAPSTDPVDWDRFRTPTPTGKTFTARAAYQVSPELQVGVSYSRGSYLGPTVADAQGPVVPGRQSQEIRAADATWRHGYLDLRGELVFNRWDVFRVTGDPRDVSYYLEAKRTIVAGLFVAGRYSGIAFREVESADGRTGRWDDDTHRWQVAGGYRLGRNSEVRAEYMVNRTTGTGVKPGNLLSLQWWLTL